MHRLQERGPLAPLSAPGRARRRSRRRALAAGGTAIAVLAADQLSKALVVSHLADGRSVHLLGPFSLALAYNRGVAFSIGSTIGAPLVLLVGAIVVFVVLGLGRQAPGVAGSIAIGLICGGAAGNRADRIFRPEGVVDFLHSGFWPTFNLADSAITVGCVLLAVTFWRGTEAR